MSVQPSKRVRRDDDAAGEDYFTSLPDDLLIQILNFLDIRQAINTHTLSRRWRFLWAFRSDLCFDVDAPGGVTPDFVDRVMDEHRGSTLHSLAIVIHIGPDSDRYSDILHEYFGPWVQFAVDRGVAHLDLACCQSGTNIAVPDEVYLASSVTRLCMTQCLLESDEVSMRRLREVRLFRVAFYEYSFEVFCSGCPVLELVVLENCVVEYGMAVSIKNPSVQRLVMVYGFDAYDLNRCHKMLRIIAPDLKFLELRGVFKTKYEITVPSLVAAKLDFSFSNKENLSGLKELLTSLNCSNLQLCGWCIQVLSLSQMKQLDIDPYNNVKHLHLRLPLLACELLGLSRMVEVFPNLESLEVSFGFWDGGEREPPSDDMNLLKFSISDFCSTEWDEMFDDNQGMSKLESEGWEPMNNSCFSQLRNLKVTDFNGFFGFGNLLDTKPSQMCKLHWNQFRRQIQLVQKLVKSSPVLERTVIELPVCKNLDSKVELALRQLLFAHVDEKSPASSHSQTILWCLFLFRIARNFLN